jgi:hypothetical protein
MKKVFLVLGLMVILFAGISMKTADTTIVTENPPPCWVNFEVSWSGSCTIIGVPSYYEVTVVILNVCNQTGVFYEQQQVTPPNLDTEICIENKLCSVDQLEKCFNVSITVKKISIKTGEVQCQGSTLLNLNCEELMALDNTSINIELN